MDSVYKKVTAEYFLKKVDDLLKESRLQITSSIFIPHLILPLLFMGTILYFLFFDFKMAYLFPFIILCIFLAYRIWILFEPINSIKIDRINRQFVIISRNPISHLLFSARKVDFAQILTFRIIESDDFLRGNTRYIITAFLKESEKVIFTQCFSNADAERIKDFFTKASRAAT